MLLIGTLCHKKRCFYMEPTFIEYRVLHGILTERRSTTIINPIYLFYCGMVLALNQMGIDLKAIRNGRVFLLFLVWTTQFTFIGPGVVLDWPNDNWSYLLIPKNPMLHSEPTFTFTEFCVSVIFCECVRQSVSGGWLTYPPPTLLLTNHTDCPKNISKIPQYTLSPFQ